MGSSCARIIQSALNIAGVVHGKGYVASRLVVGGISRLICRGLPVSWWAAAVETYFGIGVYGVGFGV